MKSRILSPRELDPGLRALWNGFRSEHSVYRSPFYTPEFTRAVGAVRNDARVAVLERDGAVIGFLPFHVARGGVAKPIGGHLCDYQGPILASGVMPKPAEILKAAGIAAYDYNHLPVYFGPLASTAHSFSVSPQLSLSDGYEAYAARRGAKFSKARREMRRRWRKTEAEFGPIRYVFHDPSPDVYIRHVELKNELYRRLGVQSVLDLRWAAELLERIRETQMPDFAAVMSTLYAGDRLIASHFGIRSRTVWHWWFPAYDLELQKLGPGINLIHECAVVANSYGLDTIDFGRGDSEFKLLFADKHVELCEGSMSRADSAAGILRALVPAVVGGARRLPLGRYESYPRRAMARLISGVTLSERRG